MPLGTSIFLIAVGAILRYAVTTSVQGVALTTVGLILMIVGALGFVVSLLYMFVWAHRAEGPPRGPYERPPPPY
jgi:uncharacterized membrane-anchored protein